MRGRKLAVLDFETDPFEYDRPPQAFVVGFYDGDTYRHFWGADCAKQIADYVRDKNYVIYAHNGGKFDFYFLLKEASCDVQVINSRIAVMNIGKSILRDSYLILPLPLSAHKKDVINYDIFEEDEREKPKNKAAILEYLESDCIYLYEWVAKFREKFGGCLTLPSASFNELRKTGYIIGKATPEYDAKYRPYYYGGRTEAFKVGHFTKPCKVVDINSAYPYAMLDEHPYGHEFFEYKELPETGFYFATILATSRGALPRRITEGKKKGSLIFDNDGIEREYHVTSWEIRAGLDTGTLDISKLIRCLVPGETQNFREFVEKFFALKAEAKAAGDKDSETFSKLILNASYGKFALNPEKFREFKLTEVGELPIEQREDETRPEFLRRIKAEEWALEADSPFGISIWSKPDPGDTYYNVATAASITGYVRAYLWRAICASKNVLYCDTDSLVCETYQGIVGPKIGEWEIEGETSNVFIGGKKLYAMKMQTPFKGGFNLFENRANKEKKAKWKTACKGCRLSPAQIIKIVKGGRTIVWYNDAPTFSLTRGLSFISRKIKVTGKGIEGESREVIKNT